MDQNQNIVFSIIIPCFNCEDTIYYTLKSIKEQSFNSIEIILIDDCSTDGTREILRRYEKENNKIKVIWNQKNIGPGGSRNNGLIQSNGEYVLFIDSDDLFAPHFFNRLYDHIKTTSSDIIFFDYNRCFPSGKIQSFHPTDMFGANPEKKTFIALSGEAVWSLCAKKNLFTNLEFPATYLAEDVVIVPILCSLASKISSLNFVGYLYTYQMNSLSRVPKMQMLESILKSSELLDRYSLPELAQEFTFRKIRLICYNYVYVACRLKLSIREIKKNITKIMDTDKDWGCNPYIRFLPFRKRLFINLVRMECFGLVKLYVMLQEQFFSLKNRIIH